MWLSWFMPLANTSDLFDCDFMLNVVPKFLFEWIFLATSFHIPNRCSVTAFMPLRSNSFWQISWYLWRDRLESRQEAYSLSSAFAHFIMFVISRIIAQGTHYYRDKQVRNDCTRILLNIAPEATKAQTMGQIQVNSGCNEKRVPTFK